MLYIKKLIIYIKKLNALCEGIWFDIFCIWIAIIRFVESYELKKTGYRNIIIIYFKSLLIRYLYEKYDLNKCYFFNHHKSGL